MASRDVEVGGYTIPKGAMIVPHIYAAHHNPDDWPEPNTFKPERWIGPDNKIRKFDAFLPFSQGQIWMSECSNEWMLEWLNECAHISECFNMQKVILAWYRVMCLHLLILIAFKIYKSAGMIKGGMVAPL